MPDPTPMVSPSDEMARKLKIWVETLDASLGVTITPNEWNRFKGDILDACRALSAQPSEPVGWMWEQKIERIWEPRVGLKKPDPAKEWFPMRNIRLVYTSLQPSSEVVALPRLDDGLIMAALVGHYGEGAREVGIEGADMTVNGKNFTFKQALKRMFAGMRKELRARSLTTPSTPPEPQDIDFIGYNDGGAPLPPEPQEGLASELTKKIQGVRTARCVCVSDTEALLSLGRFVATMDEPILSALRQQSS